MAAKPGERATYADIEALPPNMVGELIAGVLHAHSRPATPHAVAASAIGEELGPPFKRGRGGPGGWALLDGPELHFGEDVLVPDIAGWRRERLPEVPVAPFLTLPPDWLTEVLSPSTSSLDRADKVPIYAAQRVGHVWLVDPLAQTLEILRLDGTSYRLVAAHKEGARVRAEPFDAIELELAILWAR
jgi:Uma2 family endonuclease